VVFLDHLDGLADFVQRVLPAWRTLVPGAMFVATARTALEVEGEVEMPLGSPSEAVEPLEVATDRLWKSLSENEADALARCTFFRGAFSLEDAAWVLGEQADALAGPLAACGVPSAAGVQPGQPKRFHLTDSIHRRAVERMAARQSAAITAHKYAERLVELAEVHMAEFGHPTPGELAWHWPHQENLRAVAAGFGTGPLGARAVRCLAHVRLRSGPHGDLARWLAPLPFSGRGMKPLLVAHLVLARGIIASVMGREGALESLASSGGIALSEGLPDLQAEVAQQQAHAFLREGRLEDALEAAKGAVMQAGQAASPVGVRCRTTLGVVQEARSCFDLALVCYADAIQASEGTDAPFDVIRCLQKQGALRAMLPGGAQEAKALLLQARDASRAIRDRSTEADASFSLGRLALENGNLVEAEDHLCLAARAHRRMGRPLAEGLVRLHLGLLHLDRQDADPARAELLLAADLLEPVDPQSVRHGAARHLLQAHREETAAASRLAPAVSEPDEVLATHPAALVVGRQGSWFRMPGEDRVDLNRKRVLRPLLLLLVERRLAHPGEALDVEELFAEIWVGESVHPESMKNRVYVSVANLRALGLATVLISRGDGYLLRTDMDLVLV
jgi:tetratricopeptide (TPR) repeat protein